MDTDSYIVHIKLEDIYAELAEDVERRFETSNYEVYRSLSIDRIKTVIGLMKDELGKRNN